MNYFLCAGMVPGPNGRIKICDKPAVFAQQARIASVFLCLSCAEASREVTAKHYPDVNKFPLIPLRPKLLPFI